MKDMQEIGNEVKLKSKIKYLPYYLLGVTFVLITSMVILNFQPEVVSHVTVLPTGTVWTLATAIHTQASVSNVFLIQRVSTVRDVLKVSLVMLSMTTVGNVPVMFLVLIPTGEYTL